MSILGPKIAPKPTKTIFLNFAGSLLEGLLVPLGAKMAPRPPPDLSQDRFFLILDPNLVDFGAQLGGFWSPSWWILEPILVDFGGLGMRSWTGGGVASGSWICIYVVCICVYICLIIDTYIYTYPTARGNPPPCLDERIPRPQNAPRWAPKSTKLGSKIDQIGLQNQ